MGVFLCIVFLLFNEYFYSIFNNYKKSIKKIRKIKRGGVLLIYQTNKNKQNEHFKNYKNIISKFYDKSRFNNFGISKL